MSIRSVLIIALGIASGTFAVVGGRLWGPKPSTGQVPEVKTVPVVVVKEPMGLGFTIKPELVEVKQWPVELVPPGAITDIAKAEGRVSLGSLAPGEVLLEAKLAAEGVRRGAGGMVRPGMRAYTILATSAAASVAGLILPGDQVDVEEAVTPCSKMSKSSRSISDLIRQPMIVPKRNCRQSRCW
jgi:pilus assembly protein CpaB